MSDLSDKQKATPLSGAKPAEVKAAAPTATPAASPVPTSSTPSISSTAPTTSTAPVKPNTTPVTPPATQITSTSTTTTTPTTVTSTNPIAPATPTTPSTSATPEAPTFRSSDIGKWSAKQENPFAEQNRKAAEEKKVRDERRDAILRRATPISKITLIVAGSIALIAVIILFIAVIFRPPYIPTIAGGTLEDVNEFRDILQEIYDSNDASMDAVTEAIDKAIETENGKKYRTEIMLSKNLFYKQNGYCQLALDEDDTTTVLPESIPIEIRHNYYMTLFDCTSQVGNEKLGLYYINIISDIILEMGINEGAA